MNNPVPAANDNQQKTAQLVFDTVIKANEHQDNKANRIISSISFLLAASTTILGFSLPASATLNSTTNTSERIKPFFQSNYLFDIHPALFAFTVFLVLIAVGVGFYLTALGPSFNWPKSAAAARGAPEVSSLLFFQSLANYQGSTLADFIRQRTDDELRVRLIENFASEASLIAEKLVAKTHFMSIGSLLFKFAIPWVLPLMLSNYSVAWVFTLCSYVLALVISVCLVEYSESKPFQRNKGERQWTLYGFIGLIVALAVGAEVWRNAVAPA